MTRPNRRFPLVAPRLRWALLVLVPAALICGFTFSFGFEKDQIVEWKLENFPEPSAVVFHPLRGSLFAVGDEGDLAELSLDGEILRMVHLGGDLEGIAVDPVSGNLYVLREGHEIISEVAPVSLEIKRRFSVDRTYKANPNFLKRGGDGLEGLTYVADPIHPEGGRFYAVNQYDPPVLVELALPLRSSSKKFEVAKIVAAWTVDAPPLSDVTWDPASQSFLIVSALSRKVHLVGKNGDLRGVVRAPGFMVEGLSLLPDGRIVIAQDTGGMLLWSPGESPFVAAARRAGVVAPAPAKISPNCEELPCDDKG
ncbi:MAG: hypothetical protein ACI8TX_000240 [Hyphomicrobiaceae bacterium]|jgi:hypothetical protein